MEKCRRCGCNLVLAAGNLGRLKDFVSPLGNPIGERYTEKLVGMSVRNTLTALSNVEEVCKVDLSQVKTEVEAAQERWLAGKDAEAFDHALEADSKFEMVFCKTQIHGGET
jgi:hypothetical protein